VTDNVLSFEVGVRMLRGPAAEAERKARIKACWRDARGRAYHAMVHKADIGLFGMDVLLAARAPLYAARPLTILADPPLQKEATAQ
jgi:hypothetical protein